MNIFEVDLYKEDINEVSKINCDWDKLNNSSVLITGATGLIGTFLVDVIMNRNHKYGMNCKVIILSRSKDRLLERFARYMDDILFEFIQTDIINAIDISEDTKVDYAIHLASNTHPIAYATDPIGTITTNVIGLNNLLGFSAERSIKRVLFASSNEIYGENRGDVEKFGESYCGYIDCNTLRAGYPESKRCGEALCQAYIAQKNMDIVVARLTRSYGPTLLQNDTKALSQFISKGINKENIVLKSAGTQYFSYTYVADAVAGLLYVLLNGDKGEVYNVSDEKSDIMLKDLAHLIATKCGTNVVFELPGDVESAGYSKVTKARLDSSKINNILGWKAQTTIEDGISKTIDIVRKTLEK